MSATTDTVQAVAGSIQAVAGLATVGVAVWAAWLARNAASDWRATLQQERADAALAAAAELEARIGRLEAAAKRADRQSFWVEYNAAHRARAAYAAALIACSRYFTGLDENRPSEIYNSLMEMEILVTSKAPDSDADGSSWAPTEGVIVILDRIRAEAGNLVRQLRNTLGPAGKQK